MKLRNGIQAKKMPAITMVRTMQSVDSDILFLRVPEGRRLEGEGLKRGLAFSAVQGLVEGWRRGKAPG
jgi:hypothetical protein